MILLSPAGDLDPQQARKLEQEANNWSGLQQSQGLARGSCPSAGAGALSATPRMALCQLRAKPLLIPACDFPAYGSFGHK